MTIVVLISIEALMNKITLWINIRGNDWTAESTLVIVSNAWFSTWRHTVGFQENLAWFLDSTQVLFWKILSILQS